MRRTSDFCTTIRYVALTDHESMIGDAMPIQNTAFDGRLFADPVFFFFFGASAARSVLLSLRATNVNGDALRIQKIPC